MNSLILALVIAHAVLCMWSPCYGAAMLIAVRQTIPAVARFGPLSLNTTLIVVLLLFVFIDSLRHRKDKKLRIDLFPIKHLFLPLAFLGLFAVTPIEYQWKELLQFTITELLPFVVIIASVKNEKELQLVSKAVFYSYVVIGIYGIVTFYIHANPLVLFFTYAFNYGGDLYLGDNGNTLRGALDGRATGNMTGSLPWGQYSLLVLAFAAVCPMKDKPWLKNIVILLAFCNCILTTKRSVIGPAFITILYYLLNSQVYNYKKVLKASIGLIFAMIVVAQIPVLREVFENDIGFVSREARYEARCCTSVA